MLSLEQLYTEANTNDDDANDTCMPNEQKTLIDVKSPPTVSVFMYFWSRFEICHPNSHWQLCDLFINMVMQLLRRLILMTCVCIRCVEITLIISIKTYKEVTQLVSTANKRSSSGEMKMTWRGLVYIGEMDLTLWKIKDELWSLIFIHHMEVVWSIISVTFGCEVTVVIKSDV